MLSRSCLLAVLLACAPAAFSASVDPYSDFANANPNGVWSYGYTETLGSTFHLFTDFFAAGDPEANLQDGAWREAERDEYLGVYKSFTPNQLILHPGAMAEYSVLRFTAPEAHLYAVDGLFGAFDAATTDVHIIALLNGVSVFDALITGPGSTSAFSFTQAMNTGNHLDFVVGTSGNGAGQDATALSLQVASQVASVPEPGTMALMAFGFAGVVASRLRRKGKQV